MFIIPCHFSRSIGNITVKRFFRSLKYEDIYLNNYSFISKLRAGIAKCMDFYNYNRFHSVLVYQKPMNVYRQELKLQHKGIKNSEKTVLTIGTTMKKLSKKHTIFHILLSKRDMK